jgi:hypothetical protein
VRRRGKQHPAAQDVAAIGDLIFCTPHETSAVTIPRIAKGSFIIEEENSSCIVISAVYQPPPKSSVLVHQPHDRAFVPLQLYHPMVAVVRLRGHHVLTCRSSAIVAAETERVSLNDSAIGLWWCSLVPPRRTGCCLTGFIPVGKSWVVAD